MRQGFNQHMGEKVDHIYHAIEKDAPVPQSRVHQREQPEEPVGCLRGLLIRGARRLPPGFCDVRSPTGCLSIILYERGYSSCIRSIGERVPRPGPQCASDGVSSLCCSHAAHLDYTITATHRPVSSHPQSQKSTCQADASSEPEVHMSGRRGATYQKRPCTSAGSLRWCSVVPFYRTTY
ncbi:hypothetical protein ACOMHN_008049 [Nucella lapillus]